MGNAGMKTRRLFYENVYQKEFEAKVLACGEDDRGQYVVLDQTAFYPKGGGQPSDKGQLGELQVTDVQYAGEEIRHYVNRPLEEGETVFGKIDWQRRFDLMQQHSGEHIVSGMIHEKYGYDNVGFHMGEVFITIDLNGMLEKEQVEEIEMLANNYIWSAHDTKIFCPSENERKNIVYRSKKELTGEVRLVEFSGADRCACCGTHVENTGEIGMVKLISSRKFRDGVRIEMVSGKRAFDYLNIHCRENSQIAVDLSVKPEETQMAVAHLQEEIYQLRGKILKLQNEKYEMWAKQCQDKGNVVLFEKQMEAAEIRKCTDMILNTCKGICVFMSGDDESGYKYAIGQREGDIRSLVKEMNGALCGRGGGKPFFAQGSLQGKKDDIVTFFKDKSFEIL